MYDVMPPAVHIRIILAHVHVVARGTRPSPATPSFSNVSKLTKSKREKEREQLTKNAFFTRSSTQGNSYIRMCVSHAHKLQTAPS